MGKIADATFEGASGKKYGFVVRGQFGAQAIMPDPEGGTDLNKKTEV